MQAWNKQNINDSFQILKPKNFVHVVTGLPSSVCVVDYAINGFIGDQISLFKGDALGF